MKLDGLVAGGFLSSAGAILFAYEYVGSSKYPERTCGFNTLTRCDTSQALMSILLTMESFVRRFPEAASVIVSDDGQSVYHTWPGALTGFMFAVVLLGALVDGCAAALGPGAVACS